MKPTLCHRVHGFSLVEITLALGIVSFALLSVIGLLAVSLNGSRASASDTVIASSAAGLLNELRSKSLEISGIPSQQRTVNLKYQFDIDGTKLGAPLQSGSIGSTLNQAIYRCDLTAVMDANTATVSVPDSTGAATTTSNLWRVTLRFTWPASDDDAVAARLATQEANTKTIHATLARY
jgi:uncharacterized protein (TIGR02598 family)